MRDLPNLDVIRSVAVISVVAEHLLLGFRVYKIGPFEVAFFGVFGVFLFFVLTSLVLMWSLERRPHTLDFYIRRIFRLYPLAIAAMLTAILFHAPTGGDPHHFFKYNPPILKSLVYQCTLLPTVGMSLLTVMWSLPYEVGMYVLLPVLFFYVRGNRALWPIILLWALVVITTFKEPNTQTSFGASFAYFLPGVMAYIGFRRGWKAGMPFALLLPLLALVWVGLWYHGNFHRGWIFCLIVGLALPFFQQVRSEWIVAPSRIIARYSYGIYLTHPFAIVCGLYLLHSRPVWLQLLVTAVPLVILPVAAYHLLEHPLIRLGSRVAAEVERRYEQRELITS